MDKIFADKIVKASHDIKGCAFDIETFTNDDLLEALEYFGEVVALLRDDGVKVALRYGWKSPGSLGIDDCGNINKLRCYLGL